MPASVEHMLNYLLDIEEDLTDWEREFVNNVADSDGAEPVTGPQLTKLKEIYDAH